MARGFPGGNGANNNLGGGDANGALDPATNAFTVSIWIYPTSVPATGVIVAKWNGTTGWALFVIATPARVRATLNAENMGDVAITLNAWNHIAWVKSGTGAGGAVVYVNGSATSVTSNQNLANTAIAFFWGARASGTTACMTGRMASFAAWKAVLTAAEIAALAAGAPPALVRPSGLVHIPGWGVGASGEPELNGAGFSMTEAGTITVEDHAPVGPPAPIAY